MARPAPWPAGTAGSTATKDDLTQSLWLETLTAWDRYGAVHPCPEAFVRVVIERRAKSIVRDKFAQRRDPRRQHADFEPDAHAAEPVDRDLDLRLDVEHLFDRLTPAARLVADGLRVDTMAGISRRTGIPRSTLYGRLGKIREIFQPLSDTSNPDRDVKGGDTS